MNNISQLPFYKRQEKLETYRNIDTMRNIARDLIHRESMLIKEFSGICEDTEAIIDDINSFIFAGKIYFNIFV